MKKYYFVIVFLLVLFVIPFRVKAACSYSDKVKFQKIAGNVNFSYNYVDTQYSVIFNITVSNLKNDIYMVDTSTGRTYYSNNEDFIIEGYKPGDTIRFDFYIKDSSCMSQTIFSNYVTLPSYNRFYKNTLCEGIENFDYCQKWFKHNMTYKEFYEGIIAYKNQRTSQVEIPEEKKEWDILIIEFWGKYYLFILLGIIAICMIIMYFYDRKNTL